MSGVASRPSVVGPTEGCCWCLASLRSCWVWLRCRFFLLLWFEVQLCLLLDACPVVACDGPHPVTSHVEKSHRAGLGRQQGAGGPGRQLGRGRAYWAAARRGPGRQLGGPAGQELLGESGRQLGNQYHRPPPKPAPAPAQTCTGPRPNLPPPNPGMGDNGKPNRHPNYIKLTHVKL